nr:TrbC/VirB2 family protein [Phenylobacterium aquaticum]
MGCLWRCPARPPKLRHHRLSSIVRRIQVSASRQKLLIGRVALVGVIALASASPAFAQSAGVGGNIGTFIQNIIDLLNSNVIRGLAVIAIIITGIAWMFGHLDMRRAGTVVVGIIVIFSAAAIVDLITGGSGAA